MKNKIDWAAFKRDLEASIANEKVWALGSTGEVYEMHLENIERMEKQIKDIENEEYDSIFEWYDEFVFDEYIKKDEGTGMYNAVYDIKKTLIAKIGDAMKGRTLDVSADNIKVSAVEHHSGEGLYGQLVSLAEYGFVLQWDALELPWKDMVVEDLAMVYDYLTTGSWS